MQCSVILTLNFDFFYTNNAPFATDKDRQDTMCGILIYQWLLRPDTNFESVTLCYADFLLDLWLTGPPMRADWSRDSAPPFFGVLWLCCGVLRLIVLLNWILFCILHFHIRRNRVVLFFWGGGGCSAPSCDRESRSLLHIELLHNIVTVCIRRIYLSCNKTIPKQRQGTLTGSQGGYEQTIFKQFI